MDVVMADAWTGGKEGEGGEGERGERGHKIINYTTIMIDHHNIFICEYAATLHLVRRKAW